MIHRQVYLQTNQRSRAPFDHDSIKITALIRLDLPEIRSVNADLIFANELPMLVNQWRTQLQGTLRASRFNDNVKITKFL